MPLHLSKAETLARLIKSTFNPKRTNLFQKLEKSDNLMERLNIERLIVESLNEE